MRVIAGSARGAKLKAAEGLSVRPTLDRVKESIFSMLTGRIVDSEVLDLFAGSGALGIEALSRGAANCTFVDHAEASLAVVRDNLAHTRLNERAQVVRSDFAAFLAACGAQFDLILLDPPYGGDLLAQALTAIAAHGVLREGGCILCELDGPDPVDPCGFSVYRDKRYGRVRVLLLV